MSDLVTMIVGSTAILYIFYVANNARYSASRTVLASTTSNESRGN